MRTVDAAIVGSGHNSLVAAAYLARAGWSVEVLERNDALGGAVVTEELTLPGYRHDVLSSWHPLFLGSGAYAELGDELEARGLRYRNTDVPTGAVARDGTAVLAYRDPRDTAQGFTAADGAAFLRDLDAFGAIGDRVGALLSTDLHTADAARHALALARRQGRRGTLELAAFATRSAAGWLASFEGREPDLLYAPWVLHTGLAPDAAGGALQLVALAGGLHAGGMPVVEGGSQAFVDAFARLIADHGGVTRTGVDVERVVVRDGRAVGVVAGGEEIAARRAVIANVTPTQLYGRLLAGEHGEQVAGARVQAERFRYGRGAMQIHVALSEPLRWSDPRLDAAAVVHVADGADAVSLACAQARCGLLPAEPTVVCGQPLTVDQSRAPDGAGLLWIQLQEAPYHPTGDAAGRLDVPAEGGWTGALAERYADRVLERIARHAPNLRDAVRARAILTPVDIEARNVNLVRGDPYAGATELDQALLWRPLPGHGSHRSPVDGLWHIGASTHPGPGLNAASGRAVARRLLEPSRARRLLRRRLKSPFQKSRTPDTGR
jgi:phytoene dehydrogenase-like protein